MRITGISKILEYFGRNNETHSDVLLTRRWHGFSPGDVVSYNSGRYIYVGLDPNETTLSSKSPAPVYIGEDEERCEIITPYYLVGIIPKKIGRVSAQERDRLIEEMRKRLGGK